MFLGYNERLPNILLLGSFDYNRDGLSPFKRNAGIRTHNPDLCREAKKFFDDMWNHDSTIPLREYIEKRSE